MTDHKYYQPRQREVGIEQDVPAEEVSGQRESKDEVYQIPPALLDKVLSVLIHRPSYDAHIFGLPFQSLAHDPRMSEFALAKLIRRGPTAVRPKELDLFLKDRFAIVAARSALLHHHSPVWDVFASEFFAPRIKEGAKDKARLVADWKVHKRWRRDHGFL